MDMHIAQDLPLTGVDVYALPPEEGEAVLRRQLAAAYRLVDHFGWTELIYGHLTARVPGDEPHFLINPFGLNYDEVTASNLVKIDLDGNNVGEFPYPVNYAGFVIHSAVHMAHVARHKVVMHTHTRAGMAICALKDGLLPISMVSTAFHGKLSYHDSLPWKAVETIPIILIKKRQPCRRGYGCASPPCGGRHSAMWTRGMDDEPGG